MVEVTRRAFVRQLMGMPVSVHLRGTAAPDVRAAAAEAVFAELAEVDRVFSTYRHDSDLRRLAAGTFTLDQCAPEVAQVLDLCDQASAATRGYFTAWLPGPDGEPRLDPTGLVKGWAVERAARHLAAVTGDDHYLSAGGDIVLAARPGRPPWRVAVEDPTEPAQHIAVLELSAGGVATSGTARRGAHIVDPVRGRPATELASVTVVGPSLLWADVLATAACARGRDAIDWLEWPPGYRVLAVTAAGELLVS